MQNMQKKYVSPSRIKRFWQCGYNYYLYYIQGIKKAPTVNLVLGSTLHELAKKILIDKCRTGSIVSYEEIEPYIEIEWGKQKQDRGIRFSKEEEEKGIKKVESEYIANLREYTRIYLQEFAPKINPVDEWHVEREIILTIGGYDYDIKCIFDVIEEDSFRDLKTAGKTPNQKAIDSVSQYTFYSLTYEKIYNRVPKIYQDTIIKLRNPKGVTHVTTRTVDDYNVLLNRLECYIKALESGIFIPASESDFMCCEKMCDYWEDCKYKW